MADEIRRLWRPDREAKALQAVLFAVKFGEDVCDCIPRPTDVIADVSDVLWCPDCGGIEIGQYEQAVEYEQGVDLERPAPAAAVVAQWARELQAERIQAGKPPSLLLTKLAAGDRGAIRNIAGRYGLALEDRDAE
jgi:hypothetical protein